MVELVHSIREFGLLQPIVVRPAGTRFELVMGERRWRAAERAGLTAMPAIVRRIEDADLLRDALLENIHRANLNPLEEAAAYQQLLEEFDVTHEELAARLGRSRPVISNTIRLLKLPVPVQRRVAAGVLSAGHARALLALDDPAAQEDLAARIVAEGLSVRGTEEAVTLAARLPPTEPPVAGPEADHARPRGPRRLAVGHLRHPGAGRSGSSQGPDHDRIRDRRRPGAHRFDHGTRDAARCGRGRRGGRRRADQ